MVARPPAVRTGKRVAVVGSGPAGLAAADQLNRAGHWVTVMERADRVGGLLRYGIPEFKLEKKYLERRLNLMREEGIMFRTKANVGVNVTLDELRDGFEAIVLAGGSTIPRDLTVPGRNLSGIHYAMEYLTLQNRQCEGDRVPVISAKDKHVIIIGGGDTGADCLGTAHRQGAASVRQLELLPRPPEARVSNNPWPLWPNIFRTSSAHEEGGERMYSIATTHFSGNAQGTVTTPPVREMPRSGLRGDAEAPLSIAFAIPCDFFPQAFCALGRLHRFGARDQSQSAGVASSRTKPAGWLDHSVRDE